MCCEAHAEEKRDFLADMKRKRRKTFIAWRVCCHDGRALFGYYYRPGVNYALARTGKHWWRGKYDSYRPCGLHCFTARREALSWKDEPDERIFPVQCHVDDLVAMGDGQCVMRKVTILKKDWPKKWKVRK